MRFLPERSEKLTIKVSSLNATVEMRFLPERSEKLTIN